MFDPYREWLGLTDGRRPPTLYQLLGLASTESDPQGIEAAGAQQLGKIQKHLTGPEAKTAWQLVDEINLAKSTLLNPAKRAAYDLLYGTGPKPMVAPAPIVHAAPPPFPSQSTTAPAWSATAPKAEFDLHGAAHPPSNKASFNLHDEDHPKSDDGIPSPLSLRKLRAPRGNSGVLLIGGGFIVFGLIGGLLWLAAGGKGVVPASQAEHKPENDSAVRVADSGANAKQPPKRIKKNVPDDPPAESIKKVPPLPKKDPPPKDETLPPPKKDLPPKIEPPKVEVAVDFVEAKTLRGHQRTARAIAVAPDGRQILSVADDKAVFSWIPASDKPIIQPNLKSEGVGAVFLPGGREAIVADGSKGYLIDLVGNEEKNTFATPTGGVVAIAGCLDGQHFASVLNTAQLLWWSIDKKEPQSIIELGAKAPVNCLAISGDGKLAIVGNRNDGMVGVWNLAERKLVKKWMAHAGDVVAAAFSPDGKQVATVGQDNLGKVWNPVTGSQLLTLKGHNDVPIAIAFSADGALIFTAGTDKSVRLWDSATGKAQQSFQTAEKIFSLAVDPRGRFLVAGLDGGGLQLFFLSAAAPETVPKPKTAPPL